MRLLAANSEIDDETVGFHAQQAIEKRLKAVLAANDVPFEPKHSLAPLLELLAGAGIEAPPGADWIDELTIYAVPMRMGRPPHRRLAAGLSPRNERGRPSSRTAGPATGPP
jgi:hypothetical protein